MEEMQRGEALKEAIGVRWGGTGIDDACINIIDYVLSHPADNSESLTLSQLARVAGIAVDGEELLSVIAVLASRFHVLTWNFVYFDGYGEPHYLDEDEKRHFLETGEYVDEDKGEVANDVAESIFPYFTALKEYLEQDIR